MDTSKTSGRVLRARPPAARTAWSTASSSRPPSCGAPVIDPSCFTDVSDLGADDLQRGRDHGMPTYNDLRKA